MSRISNRGREVSVALSEESKTKYTLIRRRERKCVVDLALYSQRGLADFRIVQISRNRPDAAKEAGNRLKQRDQGCRWLVRKAVQKYLSLRRPVVASIGPVDR